MQLQTIPAQLTDLGPVPSGPGPLAVPVPSRRRLRDPSGSQAPRRAAGAQCAHWWEGRWRLLWRLLSCSVAQCLLACLPHSSRGAGRPQWAFPILRNYLIIHIHHFRPPTPNSPTLSLPLPHLLLLQHHTRPVVVASNSRCLVFHQTDRLLDPRLPFFPTLLGPRVIPLSSLDRSVPPTYPANKTSPSLSNLEASPPRRRTLQSVRLCLSLTPTRSTKELRASRTKPRIPIPLAPLS